MSAHRVARVATPVAGGGETRALLRGAPGENVSVAFAVVQSGGELACATVNATIGDDGTATVALQPAALEIGAS